MAALTTNPERHSWLTKEFLKTILTTSEEQVNVKVIGYELHDAVGKGENYTSYLMRATVNYTHDNEFNTKQKTFIIKTSVESDAMSDIFKKIGLFDKEIAFYRDIVPKFKKYTKLIDENFKCAPKTFGISESPTYIVFEDLRAQNYRNMDRHIGLDFNATAMVLRKLAKLHAINVMIYDESPELFEPHKLQILSTKNTDILPAYTSGMRDCQQMCLKWPGYEHFYDKLQYWFDNAAQIAEIMFDKDDSTFNTLIHGDAWTNNIMYQFDDENNPIDVLLVDYQMGLYGPPALDLTYLFFSSTANQLFESDWDRLLKIYHAELVKSLDLVKYNKRMPSLTELHVHMLKKSLCAAFVSLCFIPTRQLATKDDPKFETLLIDSEDAVKLRYAVYEKPVVYERLQYLLDYYDRKGFFDFVIC